MGRTDLLNFKTIETNQASQEVPVNDSVTYIEQATNRLVELDFTSGNVTITQDQLQRNFYIKATNLTANRTLNIPLEVTPSGGSPVSTNRNLLINNTSAYTLTIQGIDSGASPSGDSVDISPGLAVNVYCDGVDIIKIGESINLTSTSIAAFRPSTMEDDELILRYIFTQSVTLPANLVGSYVTSGVAATAETIITVKKNGSSFGTLTFAISGTSATFSTTLTSFVAGDYLDIAGPATADTTLADVAFSFYGTKT